jgi:hypothetical protein
MAKHVQKDSEMQAIALLTATVKTLSQDSRFEFYNNFSAICLNLGATEEDVQRLWDAMFPTFPSLTVVRKGVK